MRSGHLPTYNKVKKVEYDGIIFDSLSECKYFQFLKQQQEKGLVKSFEMQKTYTLMDKYRHPTTGKAIRAITYKPDFEVTYPDDSVEVIDIKGFQTEVFKIKMKLFMSRYKVPLVLIKYNHRRGTFKEI